MEWNGMEWNGMEWSGMEWNGIERRLFQLEETYKNHLVQLPDQFRPDQKSKHVVKGVVQMPFSTDWLGALTTSLESLLQYLTNSSVKRCFLTSILNHLWCNFEAFPQILSLGTSEISCSFIDVKGEPKPRWLVHKFWWALSYPCSRLFPCSPAGRLGKSSHRAFSFLLASQ